MGFNFQFHHKNSFLSIEVEEDMSVYVLVAFGPDHVISAATCVAKATGLPVLVYSMSYHRQPVSPLTYLDPAAVLSNRYLSTLDCLNKKTLNLWETFLSKLNKQKQNLKHVHIDADCDRLQWH